MLGGGASLCAWREESERQRWFFFSPTAPSLQPVVSLNVGPVYVGYECREVC